MADDITTNNIEGEATPEITPEVMPDPISAPVEPTDLDAIQLDTEPVESVATEQTAQSMEAATPLETMEPDAVSMASPVVEPAPAPVSPMEVPMVDVVQPSAVGNQPVSDTKSVETKKASIMKQPVKKSTLMILIALIIIAAGIGFYYYSVIMSTDIPPSPVITRPNMPGMTGGIHPGMMSTGTTQTSGDVTSASGANDMTGEEASIPSDTTAIIDDSTKKGDLLQIASAFIQYKVDKSNYAGVKLHDFSSLILGKYLSEIPVDTDSEMWSGFNNIPVTGYTISPLYRDTKANEALILMARTNTPEGSNWIDADPALSSVSDISKADATKIEKLICSKITVTETSVDSLKNCTARKGSDKLRYVIIQ